MNKSLLNRWTVEDAADLYRIDAWGSGFFKLDNQGRVAVKVPNCDTAIPLTDITDGLKQRGFPLPALLRIDNLLDARIHEINTEFRKAMKSGNYRGQYKGVFPIKVNQQAQVIEQIASTGKQYGFGLEAGSKAELIIALATMEPDERLIICNGYKDEEFLTLGLQARRLGYNVIFVIETLAEVPIIIASAKKTGVKPVIGVRVKLSVRTSGHWRESAGDRGIFGLNSNELIEVVETLKQAGLFDCLQLLHYHIGSQIPNIRDIRLGVQEACRYFADLHGEGAPMQYLDLGGGLAVDYDGSKSTFVHSKNYSLTEYCADIIEVVGHFMDQFGIDHPTIITESGRATVAYSSVLLFNILDITRFEPGREFAYEPHGQVSNLKEVLAALTPKTMQECYNDALFYRDEARNMHLRGQLSLRQRAACENLFLEVMQGIKRLVDNGAELPSDLENLHVALADIYYGNFSVFQSLPDSWAINQVFPIMPIQRLNEQPLREAVIADITCDCDGKIDHFADTHGVSKTLPLHLPKDDEDYVLGVFLVGAYQETLGDLHNLLGDTHVVCAHIHDDGSFEFTREVEGDRIYDVLSYVEYKPDSIQEKFRSTAEKAVRSGKIKPQERQEILRCFTDSLYGYTYFEI